MCLEKIAINCCHIATAVTVAALQHHYAELQPVPATGPSERIFPDGFWTIIFLLFSLDFGIFSAKKQARFAFFIM